MICMVPAMSMLPSASRAGAISSSFRAAGGFPQADHARAMDRAVEMLGEPRQQRIGRSFAPEERHATPRT